MHRLLRLSSISSIVLLGITFMFSLPVEATMAACTDVVQQCTKNIRTDRTIDGTIFSCYECKQAYCKGDGDGGFVGTKTTNVCESKATIFVPMDNNKESFDVAEIIQPTEKKGKDFGSIKPATTEHTSAQGHTSEKTKIKQISYALIDGGSFGYTCTDNTHLGGEKSCSCSGGRDGQGCKAMIDNDECTDTVYGSDDLVCTDTACLCTKAKKTNRDRPKPQQFDKDIGNTKSISGNKETGIFDEADALFGKRSEVKKATRRTTTARLITPSELFVRAATNHSLILHWFDNSTSEWGVEVERGMPSEERGGINYHWELTYKVEERVTSQVSGTGLRSDDDINLNSNTKYCYRIRAYDQNSYSAYTKPACTHTRNQ